MVERRKDYENEAENKAFATSVIMKIVQRLGLPACRDYDEGRRAIKKAIDRDNSLEDKIGVIE